GWDEIGRSVEGRTIVSRRFGGGGAPLVLFGGIHGDEPASVEVVLEAVARLSGGALAEAAASTAPPLVVIPALNPDGIARGSKNSAGDVDLNRNFPARSWRATHTPGYSPGPAPLSEPEAQVLAAMLDDVRGVVAVHAPFACVNYDGPAAAWAEAVAAASGWP